MGYPYEARLSRSLHQHQRAGSRTGVVRGDLRYSRSAVGVRHPTCSVVLVSGPWSMVLDPVCCLTACWFTPRLPVTSHMACRGLVTE